MDLKHPKDLADLLEQAPQLREDIAFLRALRNMKVTTSGGDTPVQWSPGARSAIIDLRSAATAPRLGDIPDITGKQNCVLFSSGVDAYWQFVGAEFATWIGRVNAAGGSFTADSRAIAAKILGALHNTLYNDKIIYLLPLLGGNLAAARVPLRDSLGVGIAANANFVNGDFSESTGLQGNGTTKYLDSLVKPSQVGAGTNGGLGWWETNFTGAGNTEAMGCYGNLGNTRFVIDLRTTLRFFSWSNAGNRAGDTASGANLHYYGNRSSATDRRFYVNGALINTNTANDAATGANERNIILCGADELGGGILPYPGRCAVTYLTDGTLTDGEAADFHTLLDTYLITPTGR